MKFLPKLKTLNSRGVSHIIVPLLVVVAVGVVGTYLLVGSHAASQPHGITIGGADAGAKAKSKNGVLVVFSQNGDFDKAKIKVVGGNPADYKCGGSFDSTGNLKSPISIPAPIAKKPVGFKPVTCTAVGGQVSYEVTFGETLGYSPSVIKYNDGYTAVDIDAGTCTFVHADGRTKKVPTDGGNGCNGDKEDPPQPAALRVLPAYTKGTTVTGYFEVKVPTKDLKKTQCSGSVRIDNTYSNGTTKAYSYTKPLKYTKDSNFNDGKGYCVATLSTKVDKTRTADQVVGITGTLVGTPAFQIGSAGQSITVPANTKP